MPIFRDKNLQYLFERDGFVVTDLLNTAEVADLKAFYMERQAAHMSIADKMHSTNDTEKLDLILEVDYKLKEVILPKVDLLLESYDVLLGSYLVKEIGDGSETGFHQDPTMVDQQHYTSGNVWVALQDTDSHNGNLRVVKGSHRMIDTLIATPNCPVSYGSFRHRLLEFSTEIPVKAGQAIVLNHKMIHGATANHSNNERIAAIIAIKSKAAKWRFLYLEPGNSNNQIEDYRIDTQSFASLLKNQRPTHAEFVGYISHDFPQLTEKEFVRFMQTGKRSVGLGTRISSVIKTLFSN